MIGANSFRTRLGDMVLEPIDFVVTWVDDSDPAWQARKERAVEEEDCYTAYDVRYREWGLFKYWFRAVEAYAPWVNKIYLVTEGHLPEWLDTNHEKLVHVRHEDIIDSKYLPTFNTNVIELNLSKIPGLSERFVLFNDDVYLNAKVDETYFFEGDLPVDILREQVVDPVHGPFSSMLMMNLYIVNKKFRKDKITGEIKDRDLLSDSGDPILGLYSHHGPVAYRRSIYDFVTQDFAAFDVRETLKSKFREAGNLTSWVVRYWQLCSGQFVDRWAYTGRLFNIESNKEAALAALQDPAIKTVCINDQGVISDMHALQAEYQSAFETKFPDQSSFEL